MAPRTPVRQRQPRGTLRVYLRPMRNGSKWWWCAVGRDRHALALDESTTREDAYRLACQRHGAGELPARGGGAPAEATLTEILLAYRVEQESRYKPRSWRSKQYLLASFVEWMGDHRATRPSQITDALLSQWIADRQNTPLPRTTKANTPPKGAANGTINRALVAARVWLRWASTHTPPLCKPTVLERVKDLREIGRTRHALVPSPEEWRRLVGLLASEPHPPRCGEGQLLRARHEANARGAALLVACAVETGLRIDELRHVRAVDIEADGVHVRAHDGWSPKGWEERRVPIVASTADTLRAFVGWRDKALGLNGRKIIIGDHWINDRLDAAWGRSGYADEAPRCHDGRRTFATARVRAGLGIDRVRVLLGHRDVATTERYIGRYRSDADEAVVSLGVASVLEAPVAAVLPIRRGGRR